MFCSTVSSCSYQAVLKFQMCTLNHSPNLFFGEKGDSIRKKIIEAGSKVLD